MQQPLRRSRSFKVTDFGTNRKLIYDFILVINTNLPAPFPSYGWLLFKFSLARGECLTSTLSLGLIPCQYRHKWYIAKNYILWPTFLPQKVPVYLQPLLRNSPRNLLNSVKLRSRYAYCAVQGHSRSPSLVLIESSYATSYYWLIVTYLLSCTVSEI